MPSHEPEPQTKTPAIRGRNGSMPSFSRARQAAQSPSATPPLTSHKQPGHKLHKQHTVGRAHATRNTSYGKNLNKLTRIVPAQPEEPPMTSSPPQRSRSPTPSTSPREQSVKRGGSLVSLPRNRSAVSLKKNVSNVSLKKRNALKAETARLAKQEIPLRQSKLHNGKARNGPTTATVRFQVGSEDQDEDPDEDPDDGWTEDSRSQSPIATRNRSASLEPKIHKPDASPTKSQSPQSSNLPTPAESPNRIKKQRPSRTASQIENGLQSRQSSARHLDADVITSRLLQRGPQHNAPPKMSTVSATATPGNDSPRSFAHSQGSTLNGNSMLREDGVSRFIGENLSGTPGDISTTLMEEQQDTQPEPKARTRTNNSQKRPKSTGNLSSQPEQEEKSGQSSTARSKQQPSTGPYNHNLPSRTQQKLWLQRASSNIEPQQLMPASAINGGLRSAGSTALGGLNSGYGDGRDPRLQRQFEQTTQEYLVVRRFRNPVGDAIARFNEMAGGDKNRRIPPRARKDGVNGGEVGLGPSLSLKETRARELAGSSDSSGAIASLEGARGAKDDGGVGADPDRQAVEEILRRIWDRVDQPAGE